MGGREGAPSTLINPLFLSDAGRIRGGRRNTTTAFVKARLVCRLYVRKGVLSLANINVANVLEEGKKDCLNYPLAVVMLVANWLSPLLFLGDIWDFFVSRACEMQ